MVVLQVVMMVLFAVRDADGFSSEINALDAAIKDLYAFQKLADRANDMRDVQIARGYLVQHRSEEKEIFAVDQRYLYILVTSKGLFEIEGRVKPPKTASKYQNICFLIHIIA